MAAHLILKERVMAKPSAKKKKETTPAPSSSAEKALKLIGQLVLLQGVFEDKVGWAFLKFLKWLDKDDSAQD
ncbi:MAG TPA: hypothetical protein VN963_00140, partial [bacterium]|nr:hypothetical protein [bacterium]